MIRDKGGAVHNDKGFNLTEKLILITALKQKLTEFKELHKFSHSTFFFQK